MPQDVFFDITMSLDGYIAASTTRPSWDWASMASACTNG